ncbi:diphthine synthase [Clonorchis sinensis]|uniref:diphthine methyl ester synthase n=1 Tax=Clonorchis sinensis TaxID=79923 RepID=A0A3R7GCH6_CLOSI|nr:diphthine synthase [Clonorchis sinensis]
MLTFVGAGLASLDDLTCSGLKAIKQANFLYLDAYTSIMPGFAEELKELTGKDVKPADRELVEETDEIIEKAKNHNVVFIVIGDPLSATTHTDLILRAVDSNVQFKIIHNTSIMTAVGCCGLQLYNFGATVSIPFWDELGTPDSFYDKLLWNFSAGLHTLCLLDIKVKERSTENILRERKVYEPPRYMSCGHAAYQLLQIIKRRSSADIGLSSDCLAIGLARIGSTDQVVAVSTLKEMGRGHPAESNTGKQTPITAALGGPLHSLIVPSQLHPVEEEFLGCCLRSSGDFPALPKIFAPTQTVGVDVIRELFRNHNNLVSNVRNVIRNPIVHYYESLFLFWLVTNPFLLS